jgi:nucleotide-binding universal stress UspA family protein
MFKIERILVPTDFSDYAHNALMHAIDLAKAHRAKIILFHCIDEHVQQCFVDYCLSDEIMRQYESESMKKTDEKLQEEIKSVSGTAGDIEITPYAKRGIPYDEILKAQEEKNIDVIVIASHGKTGFLKNMIGSVSEKVIRTAKCPVMLIRS